VNELTILDADVKEFMESCHWNFQKSWHGRINVSVWLQLNRLKRVKLKGVLVIEDEIAQRTIPIDECISPSTTNILLTRSLVLSGKGKLKTLKIKLQCQGCDLSDVTLDCAHLKPHNKRALQAA